MAIFPGPALLYQPHQSQRSNSSSLSTNLVFKGLRLGNESAGFRNKINMRYYLSIVPLCSWVNKTLFTKLFPVYFHREQLMFSFGFSVSSSIVVVDMVGSHICEL